MRERADPHPAGDIGIGDVDVLVRDDPTASGLAAYQAPLLAPPARRRGRRLWPRVLSYIVAVFALVTFNFALPRLMPGDPIDALFIQGHPSYAQDDSTRERLQEYYHLDGSISQQYARYLKGLATADFGVSVAHNRPVRAELFGSLRWTALLLVSSTLVSVLIGLPAGVRSGWKRGKRTDRGMVAAFTIWEQIPVFVLASLAFFVFAVELQLFPIGGAVTPLNEYGFFGKIADIGRHLILPALTMGSLAASHHFLLMRSSMVSELGADYLLVGRAKGLRERRLKYRYAGRNALLPVVTGIGLQLALGMTTVIFIESVFGYPGVGEYMFGAIPTRDYPVLQATFLVLALSVVTLNLLVDLLYRKVDPRTAS